MGWDVMEWGGVGLGTFGPTMNVFRKVFAKI